MNISDGDDGSLFNGYHILPEQILLASFTPVAHSSRYVDMKICIVTIVVEKKGGENKHRIW